MIEKCFDTTKTIKEPLKHFFLNIVHVYNSIVVIWHRPYI